MSARSGSEPDSVLARLIVAVVLFGILVHAAPYLLDAIGQVMPGILVLIIIVGAIRGIIKRLFD